MEWINGKKCQMNESFACSTEWKMGYSRFFFNFRLPLGRQGCKQLINCGPIIFLLAHWQISQVVARQMSGVVFVVGRRVYWIIKCSCPSADTCLGSLDVTELVPKNC